MQLAVHKEPLPRSQDAEMNKKTQQRAILVHRELLTEGLAYGQQRTGQLVAFDREKTVHRGRQEPQPVHHGADPTLLRDGYKQTVAGGDSAPQPQRSQSPSRANDDKNRIVRIDMCTKQHIFMTAGRLHKDTTLGKPRLHARRLKHLVLPVEGAKLNKELMKNEIGKRLTHIGIQRNTEKYRTPSGTPPRKATEGDLPGQDGGARRRQPPFSRALPP